MPYFLLLSFLVLGSRVAGATDTPFETLPIRLVAAEVLPETMLLGEGYTIEQGVENDGLLNTYTLVTEFGTFTVTGDDELQSRVQEIRATRALKKLEDSDEFKEAAKSAATGLVDAGKSLIDAPGETTKAAAKGVGKWMRNIGSSITSDDPHQDNALQTGIGYDAAKRRYAIELGVDPYTDFEPFQEVLGEVARAATAGSMVTSMAINLGTAGSLAGTVVTATNLAKMKGVLKDNPPVSLAKINLQKLLDMGIVEYQAQALLKNYNYTPMEMTLICEALQQMGDVQGREVFVAFATSAPDREVAQFVRHYAELLATYMNVTESGDIVDISGSAWMLSDSKGLTGAFPIDYLAWTPGLSESLANASDKLAEIGAKHKHILLTGSVSPQARLAMEKQGWKISDNITFPAPARE